MSDSKTPKPDKAQAAPRLRLRTITDLNEALEWLFHEQKFGKIDPKTADALNTTLKGSIYINGRLKMDIARLWMMGQVKKIEIPPMLLPILSEEAALPSASSMKEAA